MVESSTVNSAETLHEIKGSLAKLKQEQEEAVVSLLVAQDVLAVLPTGFGEFSSSFQVLVSSWSQIKKRLAKWRKYPTEDSCDLPAGWSY